MTVWNSQNICCYDCNWGEYSKSNGKKSKATEHSWQSCIHWKIFCKRKYVISQGLFEITFTIYYYIVYVDEWNLSSICFMQHCGSWLRYYTSRFSPYNYITLSDISCITMFHSFSFNHKHCSVLQIFLEWLFGLLIPYLIAPNIMAYYLKMSDYIRWPTSYENWPYLCLS